MTATQFAELDYAFHLDDEPNNFEDWMLDAETWALIEACDNNI